MAKCDLSMTLDAADQAAAIINALDMLIGGI
jgi:hypothetical protein